MALNISIELHPDGGDMAAQLETHLSALGFRRAAFAPGLAERLVAEAAPRDIYAEAAASLYNQHAPEPERARGAPYGVEAAEALDAAQAAPVVASEEEAPVLVQREPGKPKPGCKRRTNAEIAEDEAFFAALAQREGEKREGEKLEGEKLEGEKLEGGSSDSIETAVSQEAYQTDEMRALAEQAKAQDRADEARETAATKTGLTHDDVRHAAGAYAKVHGLPAAIKNVPVILGCAIVEVPDTQEALFDAVRKLTIATEAPTVTAAPVVAAHIEENKPVTATKKDVVEALLAYALRYDGQNTDMKTAVHTQSDGKAIVKQVTGADHLGVVKDDPEIWGRLLVAVNAALANNSFGRAVLK